MKNPLSRFLAASICLLFVLSVAYAKLALTSLLISGGKLSQRIEVSDPELLRSSHPWFGTFLPQWNQAPRERIEGPPAGAQRYEISFYAASSPEDAPHIVYVVYYAFDAGLHSGFVYLPGRHEQWYGTNTGSILRPRQDGRWNLADRAWCERINAILSRSPSH